MREERLDVETVARREDVIMDGGFEYCMPAILRQLRRTADQMAQSIGGTVRPTIDPEIVVAEAISPILGDVFTIATRWVCDVPDNAELFDSAPR